METCTQYAETGGAVSVATISRLVILAGLLVAFALAAPGSTTATSLHEVKEFTGDGSTFNDDFGQSVAVSGDTAVVGSPLENAFRDNYGAVYVYQRDRGGAGNWGEVTKLQTVDRVNGLGASVAISGDTAVVVSGIAAYVFDRDEGGVDSWGQVATLKPNAQFTGFPRRDVAISGDTIAFAGLVSDAIPNTRAVYIYQRNEGGADNWGEVTKLTGSSAEPFDGFGASMAVSDDTIVVGAPERIGGSSPPTSNGVAYIFERNHGGDDNWGEVKKVTGSDTEPGDVFGGSVAVSGETAVVGAYRISTHPTSCCTGAAYIFHRNQGGTDNWGEAKKITSADGGRFGASVAVDGEIAVVGAWRAELAYAFQRHVGGEDNWGQVAQFSASNAGFQDFFGSSVAVSGDTGIVGAPGEDGAPIKGCCGSAYVFDLLLPKPRLTGDASCDGIVTAVDAALILQFRAGLIVSVPCPDDADADKDSDIDSIDAALILQFTAGLLNSLPP